MKIYYAHHIWKYRTKIEEYELLLLESHFPNSEIFNPSVSIFQNMSESKIMESCFEVIKSCDCLAFSSVNGVVGKGVYDEINLALALKLPVFYIFNNKLIECKPCFELTNDSFFTYATISRLEPEKSQSVNSEESNSLII